MSATSKPSPRVKSKSKVVRYADFDQLTFPSYITASLMLAEQGVGLIRGVYMLHARSADELRSRLVAQVGDYFAEGCEAKNGLVLMPGFEDLIPASIHSLLEKKARYRIMPAMFSFNVTLHVNYT